MIPLQEPEAERLSGQSVEHLRQAAHFVREDGLVFAGAAAGRELARFLPGGRIVRAVTVVPGVMLLAERAYRWIARTWGPAPK